MKVIPSSRQRSINKESLLFNVLFYAGIQAGGLARLRNRSRRVRGRTLATVRRGAQSSEDGDCERRAAGAS
jgi:hypothetical protein